MTAKQTGNFGESIAVEYLVFKGFTIIETQYHSRYGEIDIIAANEDYIVFVEVKTRRSAEYGSAAGYVDFRKQNKLKITAELWLQANSDEVRQPRFDVIEVYTGISQKPAVRWIIDAFN